MRRVYAPDVFVLALLHLACADPPLALPAESGAKAIDRAAEPALYRQLYDYAFLPETQDAEQRVRILIWLRHMDFNRYQLGLLQELHARFQRERTALAAVQQASLATHEPEVRRVYDRLWEGLQAGASDADLARVAQGLDAVRAREADLLQLRAQGVRTLLEALEPLLRTLTPRQEALMADATFLLRHRLDPYATPEDFQTLVGTVYTVGEFGALTRPTFDPNEDFLDIAGLWSPEGSDLEQARFPDVRRDVVLYMVLLEPGLSEALRAGLALRPDDGAAASSVSASAPSAPPSAPGVPGGGGTPTPGRPAEPVPGRPDEPSPGIPSAPTPATP